MPRGPTTALQRFRCVHARTIFAYLPLPFVRQPNEPEEPGVDTHLKPNGFDDLPAIMPHRTVDQFDVRIEHGPTAIAYSVSPVPKAKLSYGSLEFVGQLDLAIRWMNSKEN